MCLGLSGRVAAYACYSGVFTNIAPFHWLTCSSLADKLHDHPACKAISDLPYSPDAALASYLAQYLPVVVIFPQLLSFTIDYNSMRTGAWVFYYP